MNAVFLSSSVAERDPWRTRSDPMTVREAVLALTAVWLPHGELVFGGHPAISPLVEHAARSLRLLERVHIYQSRFFEKLIPDAAKQFPNLHWVPAAQDRAMSLALMRREMITSPTCPRHFQAAVFIGGMEGIEEELQVFQQAQPQAALIPVASTGAAARQLFDRGLGPADAQVRDKLLHASRYRELFRELILGAPRP